MRCERLKTRVCLASRCFWVPRLRHGCLVQQILLLFRGLKRHSKELRDAKLFGAPTSPGICCHQASAGADQLMTVQGHVCVSILLSVMSQTVSGCQHQHIKAIIALHSNQQVHVRYPVHLLILPATGPTLCSILSALQYWERQQFLSKQSSLLISEKLVHL